MSIDLTSIQRRNVPEHQKGIEFVQEWMDSITPSKEAVTLALKVVGSFAALAAMEDAMLGKPPIYSWSGVVAVALVAGIVAPTAQMFYSGAQEDRITQQRIVIAFLAMGILLAAGCLAPGKLLPELVEMSSFSLVRGGLMVYPIAVLACAWKEASPETREAVRQFQRNCGMRVFG